MLRVIKRVITPSQAIRNGSDLVVGRPITQAASPSAALAAFNSEIASVKSENLIKIIR